MSISAKDAVKKFRKNYDILKPSLGEIKNILKSQGYTIIEFNAIFNDEDVSAIIENLKLDELISERKGFTYVDSNYRMVFVHEDLSDSEKLSVLLHEEGHISCGHIEENTYIGRDVQQEVEANEFVYYLQNPRISEKCNFLIKRNKLLVSVISIILVVIVICFCCFAREKQLYADFVITDTGNKYHKAECIHVKNKKNINRLTVEQFETGEYEACGTCLPQN